jgi:ABC transport system ATP-binding/permease protein
VTSTAPRVLALTVDAFAGFATLDGRLDADETDLILDLLRSAFPDVDHSWLARRVQRAVNFPKPLARTALDLRERLDDNQKLAVGLQLFTLMDAVGRSERNRSSFETFLRRMGNPEHARLIQREMRGECTLEEEPGFERVIFGPAGESDVTLPPQAQGYAFRTYRAADLVLVRNTGQKPLWFRGRSLETGEFLRLRPRQQIVVPGWTLNSDDLLFFLNVKKTGTRPVIFVSTSQDGFSSERNRSRQSEVRIRFGLKAEVEALRNTDLGIAGRGLLTKNTTFECSHHERIVDPLGFSTTIDALRRRAAKAGGRFRLEADHRDFLISNDPGEIERGDMLLAPGLAPRVVLRVRFDPERGTGELYVQESEGSVTADGIMAKGVVNLREGSIIRLSPSQALRCRFSDGILIEERSVIEKLRVQDLIHEFSPGVRSLDNISFEVNRGEMLCIIGPSGSGKSTLLSTIAGQLEPLRGRIRLNDSSLYEHWDELIPFIAYMPQEEALNPHLTVREHLYHATTIRRPFLSSAQAKMRADAILAELGLQALAHRRVGSPGEKTLSGGERSRLNLGLDLGSAAEIFLFDEPISGLSSKDSEHVAETLRSLAREKIVIASLHRPGASVLGLFDKVMLLDNGGRLAFFGSPAAMIAYFREACAEEEIHHPSVAAKVPLGADFVFDVLEIPMASLGGGEHSAAVRRFPPNFWQERFESRSLLHSIGRGAPVGRAGAQATQPPALPRPSVGVVHQVKRTFGLFRTLFQRSLLSKLRNKGTAYVTLLESPILAALIGITLKSSPNGTYDYPSALHIPAYLFLSATVAMFLGLTNAATEILRERPVLRRERNCLPNPHLYVASKFCVLALVGAIQCLVYAIIGHLILEIRGTLIEQWLWMTATASVGSAMALLVSALAKSERVALTAVPLLLVPQMLLAGALVPFREMNRGLFMDATQERSHGGTPIPARLMPLRYAYEAMVITQATRNPFEYERLRLQRKIENIKDKPDPLSNNDARRLQLARDANQRMLAAGAKNVEDAGELAAKLSYVGRKGTELDIESIPIWPRSKKTKPLSDFFVNERIDLMIREAETFRLDYRNSEPRRVFLALEKPLFHWTIDSLDYAGAMLGIVIFGCCGLTAMTIHIQNRKRN